MSLPPISLPRFSVLSVSSSHLYRVALMAALSVSLLGVSTAKANPQDGGSNPTSLEQNFQTPPDGSKPWAYWWWLKANVDEASITRDLEEMKAKGFGGLLMFDARGYHEGHVPPPPSKADFMSPEWRRLLKYSMKEADRLGIQMSVNLSICAGALKGPWNVGADSPKNLVWTAARVEGAKPIKCQLKKPEQLKYYNDVALLAVRRADGKVIDPSKDLAEALATQWQKINAHAKTRTAVNEVVDLTDKVDAQGNLSWNVPEGSWIILRFGYSAMDGHEFDVDVLDPKAVEGHYNRMGKALVEDAGALAGKTLTHFYSVSWEGAIPTWTGSFEKDFTEYRGYCPRNYMPVLAGMEVRDDETTRRFLEDYYKTLGDCFREKFYGTLRRLSNQDKIKWHSESGGPWNRGLPTFQDADQLAFLGNNEMPQGEFWHPGRYMNRQPAMASHIYGRPLAATEAFTHMHRHWDVCPSSLKPCADETFCDGINQFIWHTFTASPPELGKPGSEYFAGTHVNPNVTWFQQLGPVLGYLGRCQHMLRQGHYVADVCCYVSDAPYQNWGRFKTWRGGSFLQLGPGHTYDLITTEVLANRLSVDSNGDLVLPDGMRYRVLAIDLASETVPLPVIQKLVKLAEDGATIVLGDMRAGRSPGLGNYPANDKKIIELANQLWGPNKTGDSKERNPVAKKLGKGTVYTDTTIADVFKVKGILPDFQGPWDYTHRNANGTDIYFVDGAGAADCTFRVSGKTPELWNPLSGEIRDAVQWRATEDGLTIVPLNLPENGSTFVVFRKPVDEEHLVSVVKPDNDADGALELVGCEKGKVCLNVWKAGEYALTPSQGETKKFSVNALYQPIGLTGPWKVDFVPGVGKPFSAELQQLSPWNESEDAQIKYFSGTATYTKAFELNETQAQGLARLQLGTVKDIASVRLNGKPLGIVWTAPWSIDLTGATKAGKNVLEIDVTNTWVNRLIGDAGLPPEQRLTKTNVLLQKGKRDFPGWKGFASEDPLTKSGLLGPVWVEFGTQKEVNLK